MEQDSDPAVTIITPVLDQVERVGRAVESVVGQELGSVEHIVVDGGSTDGTLDVLARYPHLRVVSERDGGVYDAVNKGIRLSRGGIIGHLNSDDVYLPGALERVVQAFAGAPEAESACGGVEVVTETADGSTRVVARYDDDGVKRLRPFDVARGVPITNGRFFRRALYDRVGAYDPSFHVAGDREFLLRALIAGMRTVPLPGLVYRYTQHPGSLTIGPHTDVDRNIGEYARICRAYLSRSDLPPHVGTELRLWLGRDIGRRFGASLRSRRPDRAMRWAWRGFAVDPVWPLWHLRDRRAAGVR